MRFIARLFRGKINGLLYMLFFPLRYSYLKQSGITYDGVECVYVIHGMQMSEKMFAYFSRTANYGEVFRFVKLANGVLTIQRMEYEHNYSGINEPLL